MRTEFTETPGILPKRLGKGVDLEREVLWLREQLDHLSFLLEQFGLPVSTWVSPEKAAELSQTSRRTIVSRVERAEAARLTGEEYPVRYGTHYRNDQGGGEKPRWKINIRRLDELNGVPPD